MQRPGPRNEGNRVVFGRLFRRDSEAAAIATALYGAIVAQARDPVLYRDYRVADTVDGRFEMVVLHTILILDRLQEGGGAAKAAGQATFDLYCQDMDRSLRELGIGDLGVPKRMKKMTERFYGRAAAYRTALAASDAGALREIFERNVFNGAAPGAAALAGYAIAQYAALRAVPPEALLKGQLPFTAPSTARVAV
jgi:cytochrome b pre-mRNA-processing protein 3